MATRRLVWSLVLVAIVGIGRARAEGRNVNRVVFIGVSGTGGGPFADQVILELAEAYTVMSGDTYRRAAQSIGRPGANEDDVRAVCGTIRADALIAGAVRIENDERVLRISIRDGVTGRVVVRLRYLLTGTTLPQMRDKVVSDLVRHLSRLDQADVNSDDKPTKSSDDANANANAPRDRDNDESTAVTTPRAPQPNDRSWPGPGLTFGIGPTLTGRTLHFDNNAEPGYHGGSVAGLAAYAMILPVALSPELASTHPVLSSFGIEAEYEHIFGFHSTTSLTSEAGSASRWLVRFIGRIPLGHRARGGILTLSTGYQHATWSSSSPTNLDVPNVSYGLLDAGLRYEHALGSRYASLALRGAGLALVGGAAGGITSVIEYGSARGAGIDVSATLQANPTRWLWLRLSARYTGVFLTFDQTGARFARSATDSWISGSLEMGFAL